MDSSLDPKNVAPLVKSHFAMCKIQMDMLLLLSYILMILGIYRVVYSDFNCCVVVSSRVIYKDFLVPIMMI